MSEYILTHKHHTHTHAASGWRIHCGVEVTGLSTNKQLSHITDFFLKKNPAMQMTKQISAFFFCFIRELNPLLPPYLLPHSAREIKPFTPPLPSLSPPRANSNPLHSPLALSLYPHLSAHTSKVFPSNRDTHLPRDGPSCS
jgi:hypothetical protein